MLLRIISTARGVELTTDPVACGIANLHAPALILLQTGASAETAASRPGDLAAALRAQNRASLLETGAKDTSIKAELGWKAGGISREAGANRASQSRGGRKARDILEALTISASEPRAADSASHDRHQFASPENRPGSGTDWFQRLDGGRHESLKDAPSRSAKHQNGLGPSLLDGFENASEDPAIARGPTFDEPAKRWLQAGVGAGQAADDALQEAALAFSERHATSRGKDLRPAPVAVEHTDSTPLQSGVATWAPQAATSLPDTAPKQGLKPEEQEPLEERLEQEANATALPKEPAEAVAPKVAALQSVDTVRVDGKRASTGDAPSLDQSKAVRKSGTNRTKSTRRAAKKHKSEVEEAIDLVENSFMRAMRIDVAAFGLGLVLNAILIIGFMFCVGEQSDKD